MDSLLIVTSFSAQLYGKRGGRVARKLTEIQKEVTLMKTTVRGIILNFNQGEQTRLDRLMGDYCATIRWSYKRLLEGEGELFLNIAADSVKTENSFRYNRITVPVYLAQKLSQKTGKVNGHNYRQMVIDYLKKGKAYQVEILRENNRYYVHVTIEENPVDTYKPYNGVYGVDTNPHGLGITNVDYLGQYRGSRFLNQGEWRYARTNRRLNLIGEVAGELVLEAKHQGKALAVEDLKFSDDKSVSVKFNRLSHNFIWSKFLQAVERRAIREGVPLIKVKPPYTSVIGILKYQQQYGISNHEAAGYVIGRRALGYSEERIPAQLLRFLTKSEHKTFHNQTNWKQWSLIEKSVFKILKQKGVNNLVSWQHFEKIV